MRPSPPLAEKVGDSYVITDARWPTYDLFTRHRDHLYAQMRTAWAVGPPVPSRSFSITDVSA